MMRSCFLIALNCTQEGKNTQYSAGDVITTTVKRFITRVKKQVKIALLMNQVCYRSDIFGLSLIFNIFLLNRWMDHFRHRLKIDE